jgi:hypothetical protein
MAGLTNQVNVQHSNAGAPLNVMLKTLNVTTTNIAPTASPTTMILNTTPSTGPSVVTSFKNTERSLISSQPVVGVSFSGNPPSASSEEILNQAIQVAMSNDSLSEDELLATSLLFTSTSDNAVYAACTFVTLGNNQVVQHCFLLCQLDAAALLPGRGNGG